MFPLAGGLMKKIAKFIITLVASGLCLLVIVVFEINSWPVGSSIAGIIGGFLLPTLLSSVQDLFDNTNWKTFQRNLERGRFINANTLIRISFAYLFQIKIENKYLLVKNERGTGKFQPVGGVYKLKGNEKIVLKTLFQVKDDDKVLLDESSRDDYRLRIENKHLRKFMKRFDKKADRERISDLSREFKEELIDTEILDWNSITYRYCGRHITDLHFGEHFQTYELLLADIVELIPTEEQRKDLQDLMTQSSNKFQFATPSEIKSRGIDVSINKLTETIADHAQKVIQENEGQLIKLEGTNDIYTVDF